MLKPLGYNTTEDTGGGGNMTVWTDRGGHNTSGQQRTLEAPLSETEIRLLKTSP